MDMPAKKTRPLSLVLNWLHVFYGEGNSPDSQENPLCDGREMIVEMDLYFSIRKASYVPICIDRM